MSTEAKQLTADDVRGMEAGREMDAMVFDRLFREYMTGENGERLDVTRYPAGLPDGADPCKMPAYTTDPAADYFVLRHVREKWCADDYPRIDDFRTFCEELKTLWWPRSRVTMHYGLFTLYQPGDYSRAALLTTL